MSPSEVGGVEAQQYRDICGRIVKAELKLPGDIRRRQTARDADEHNLPLALSQLKQVIITT